MAESKSKQYVRQFEEYYCNDEPVPYKDLLIYPVKVKDYYKFYIAVNILTIEKNTIKADPQTVAKFIGMKYLDFIIYMIENDPNGQYYGFLLIQILHQCLHAEEDKIRYQKNDKGKVQISIEVNNQTSILNGEDFDNIRYIILYQNIPDQFDDTYINPEVKQILVQALMLKNKNQGKMCSFEEQKVCVNIINGMPFDQINDLTLRKFNMILDFGNKKMNYEICKTGEMSGMVEFKEEITHWMMQKESKFGKYESVLTNFAAAKANVESPNGTIKTKKKSPKGGK